MSKAEQIAMEHCCTKCVHDKFGCSMKVLHNGRDCIKCGNYIKGYEQAEKELELTWEDIREICRMWIESKTPFGVTGEALSIEVLKRFNKERKEK